MRCRRGMKEGQRPRELESMSVKVGEDEDQL